MTVYLDLVMGLNFCVDLLLLLGTNRLAGYPPGWKRCAGASALGAVYAGACLMPGMYFLGSWFWRMVFLWLMGLVAFGYRISAWRRTGIFLLLSLALGGLAAGTGGTDILALILSAVCVRCLSEAGLGTNGRGRGYLPVRVYWEERSFETVALKDTGNSLLDPLTGEPVLILGPEAAGKLLGLTQEELADPMQLLVTHPELGLRLIPYRAVGSVGMLVGKRFPQVWLGGETGARVVAFAPEVIGQPGVYQALAGGMV